MTEEFINIFDLNIETADLYEYLDQTPRDVYFSGETRFRSMSRVDLSSEGEVLRVLPQESLFQSYEINPIKDYGGINRSYDNLPKGLLESEALKEICRIWTKNLGGSMLSTSIHHIKTFAPGNPTPEGRHRDGYDYVGIAVLRRQGVSNFSGVTKFWDKEEDKLIFEEVLPEGKMIIFDDRVLLHETTALSARNGEIGVRDVLIFTYPDHSEVKQNSNHEG